MALDPFCGCATTCDAAEMLARQWIVIDISPKALLLTKLRLKDAMDGLFHDRLVTARADTPRRNDIDTPIPFWQNKHVVFAQGEGRCNGCRTQFPFRAFAVDHIIPCFRGRPGRSYSMQFFCTHGNSAKRDRPQECFLARLKDWASHRNYWHRWTGYRR